MEIKHLTVPRTARYAQLGNLSEKTKTIWFVFHGYGHLAEHFIRKFSNLESDDSLIIAPEALSRFYLDGFSGRVGASWMTKENRLNEIEDYLNYFDILYQKIGVDDKQITVNLIGFSQGTSTASRVFFLGKNRVDNLYLIAGSVPDDIPKEVLLERLKAKDLLVLYGKEDKLIPADIVKKEMLRLAELGVEINYHEFAGGHTVNEESLAIILEEFKKISK